jgi:hypothetical protein
MKILFSKGLNAFAFLMILNLGSTPVLANSLDFVLSDQTVRKGDRVTVDVFFSDPEGTIVRAYDLFII